MTVDEAMQQAERQIDERLHRKILDGVEQIIRDGHSNAVAEAYVEHALAALDDERPKILAQVRKALLDHVGAVN